MSRIVTNIKKKIGDFRPMKLEVNLTDYFGKSVADITDWLCVIKGDRNDPDSLLFEKYYSTGDITYLASDPIQVYVPWTDADYNAFETDNQYILGLFPKFSGENQFDQNTNEFVLTFVDQLATNN